MKTPLQKQMGEVVEQLRVGGITLDESVREFKKTWITQELALCRGCISRTARNLGKHRNTLSRDMTDLGIRVAEVINNPIRKAIQCEKLRELIERSDAI